MPGIVGLIALILNNTRYISNLTSVAPDAHMTTWPWSCTHTKLPTSEITAKEIPPEVSHLLRQVPHTYKRNTHRTGYVQQNERPQWLPLRTCHNAMKRMYTLAVLLVAFDWRRG